jgi:hypothetical protein
MKRFKTVLLGAIAAALFAPNLEGNAAAQHQQKPGDTASTVVVKGEPIIVPRLPTSTAQARTERKTLLKSLAKTKGALEKDIIQMYKNYPAEKIPMSISIPAEKYESGGAAFLLSILCDKTVDSFLDKIMNQWNAWQVTLLKYGMVRFISPQTMEMAKTIEPYEFDPATKEKIETILRDVRQPSASHLVNKSYGEWDLARVIIADSIVPDLSQTWESFRAYLDDRLNKLADFPASEITSQDPDIKRLFDTASIVLFEQIRLALWVCDNVWSRVATYEKPNSLKPLRGYSIQTQVDSNQNIGEVVVRQTLVQQDHLIYF